MHTNRRVAFVLTIIAGLPRTPIASGAEPDPGGAQVVWSCDASSDCSVSAITQQHHRIDVYHGRALSPGVRKHGKSLSEFRMSCGSPCSISIFVNLATGAVSQPVENVVAVDNSRLLIAIAGESAIDVQPIFKSGRAPIRIKRDFAPAAALASVIRSAKFQANGTLDLTYLKGNDFVETHEEVPLGPIQNPDAGAK